MLGAPKKKPSTLSAWLFPNLNLNSTNNGLFGFAANNYRIGLVE